MMYARSLANARSIDRTVKDNRSNSNPLLELREQRELLGGREMITVDNTVPIFEVDGRELPIGQTAKMHVASHSNWDTLIVLTFEGKSITVSRRDLEAASQNSVNSNRFGR
jgi:hypothetical protein